MPEAARLARRIARWPRLVRSACTLGLVAAATILRAILDPVLGERHIFVTYFAAALLAALLFGTASSALALLLGTVCAVYFFLEPQRSFGNISVQDWVGIALYLLTGALLAAVAQRLHAAVRLAQRSRAEAESALAAQRQAEEEYRVAFELAAVGKAQTDAVTGRFLRVNDRFCQMLGYTREELLGMTVAGIAFPGDLERNAEDFRRVVQGEVGSLVLERRCVRKDGWPIWVRVAGALAHDERGRPWQVSATFEDITERRIQDDELRRSRDRFRHLANAVPAFVWTATADGMVDFINERWLRYTGMTAEESLGRGWRRALHPEDGGSCPRLLEPARERGEPFETEVRYRRADGEYRWFTTRAEPVRDESGRITAWFGTDMDIHDYRLARERLARSAGELARSNADLENFAHIAAHDLKEPLRGIRLTAGFLAEDASDRLTESERRGLRSLDRLATRMHDLLDAMLEYSRVGRSGLDLRETDLEALVREVRADLFPRLHDGRAELRVPGPLPPARCDPTLVGTVLRNLVANALKYNRSDPKIVEVGALDRGPRPVYFVRDNGIGIDPRQADQVFRMFKRLHPREGFGGGTGAGLAIVKKIIERHGGRIWFESSENGSTFYFTLSPARGHGNGAFPGRSEQGRTRESGGLQGESGGLQGESGGPQGESELREPRGAGETQRRGRED